MTGQVEKSQPAARDVVYHLAILGGGRNCRNLLEFFQRTPAAHTQVAIVGVCDINPDAEGMVLARDLGLRTTRHYRQLLESEGLDGVIDMTGDRALLAEVINHAPQGLAIFDRNSALLLKDLLEVEQKSASEEQQAILERMSVSLLFRQTNAAVIVLNTDYTIFDANEAFLRLVKRSKKEVVGAYCYEVTRGLNAPCSEANPEFKCPMVETLQTGETAFVIQQFPVSQGQTIYCNTVTYPLKDHQGKIVRVVELRRDVTEEISSKWDKRIRDLQANVRMTIQEDRMISLGKLVASCVHEINNPIQGMLTFTHLMQTMLDEGLTDEKDLEKFKSFVQLMSHELERCGDIVSGLLSFSRESPMEDRDVAIQEVLDAVLMLTRHKMELQKIRLGTKMSKRPLVVRGDANQLQQCFLNLIFNAMEAMPDGGRLTVALTPTKTRKRARVEISDTGCGIPKDNLSHIFDPFFTTKGNGEGTGLGLSIVYGVVKNHGGSIEVDSEPGKGTSFVLYLPTQ